MPAAQGEGSCLSRKLEVFLLLFLRKKEVLALAYACLP
jgi:hypothetical protein